MQAILQKPKTGTVKEVSFFSEALGVEKSCRIYLPPGYHESGRHYPVVYLFRGHEKEWFDPHQDHSRGGRAVQHLADALIAEGAIEEMIIVGPGMTSDDGGIYGLGVNFLNARAAKERKGIGRGRFEDYFVQDVIGYVEQTYRTLRGGRYRAADGFSLGGYTSIMLAIKHPGLFASVGSYDGSHMFRGMNDPRYAGEINDTLWVRRDNMFVPAFRRPKTAMHDVEHLLQYNPLQLLQSYSEEQLAKIRDCRFYITSAAFDDMQGNRDRGVHLLTVFQLYRLSNRADALVLAEDAHHNWKFADLHLRYTLKMHSQAFRAAGLPGVEVSAPGSASMDYLELISLEDSTPARREVRIHYHVYREMPVKIEVCTASGERVVTLAQKIHSCGRHKLQWDGNHRQQSPMSSGSYQLTIQTPLGSLQKSFALLR